MDNKTEGGSRFIPTCVMFLAHPELLRIEAGAGMSLPKIVVPERVSDMLPPPNPHPSINPPSSSSFAKGGCVSQGRLCTRYEPILSEPRTNTPIVPSGGEGGLRSER